MFIHWGVILNTKSVMCSACISTMNELLQVM